MGLVPEWVSQTANASVSSLTLTPPTTPNQAIVVVVDIRTTGDTVTISGGGLTWTKRSDQTSARNNHRVELHTAYGTPNGTDISAAFSDGTGTRTLSARSWTGADPTTPFIDFRKANTLGENGASSGGTDNDQPTLNLVSAVNGSLHFIATGTRTTIAATGHDILYNRTSLVADGGTSGDRILTYLHERFYNDYGAGSHTITHTTSAVTDWVTVGCVVQPQVSPTAAPAFGTGDLILSEPFTYTNGSLWDTANWDGPLWVGQSNLSITSNQVTVSTATYRDAYTVASSYFDADYILSVVTAPGAGIGDAALNFYICATYGGEFLTEASGYMIAYETVANQFGLGTIYAGSQDLGSIPTQVISSGSKIGIRKRGSNISSYYYNGSSWSQIGTTVESGMWMKGRVGIESRSTALVVDNLEIRSISTTSNLPRPIRAMRQAVKRASHY
jgi:hypothetical protein